MAIIAPEDANAIVPIISRIKVKVSINVLPTKTFVSGKKSLENCRIINIVLVQQSSFSIA